MTLSTDQISDSATFAQGFFVFLQSRGMSAAVLHGGGEGFKHELSDVDFVVEQETFASLPNLILEYCTAAGWQLCQVLRHETTAAFYVCSAGNDPSCAVALDACSDYQRNGTLFLTAEELLEERRELAWGGHGLNPAMELRYRFAKAAAKNKEASACEVEFACYPEEVRRDCAAWLDQAWGITLASWDLPGLTLALRQFTAKANTRPSLLHLGTLSRILSRILRPTGLVVIAGRDDFDATAARLESVFGHLYFRRFKKIQHWQPALFKELVASTLIVVPDLGVIWTQVLPADCIHRMVPGEDCRAIAKHLHQRCQQREAR